MGILKSIREWVKLALDANQIKKEFGTVPIKSTLTDIAIGRCVAAYSGTPDWVDTENNVHTVNFAETICSEVAQLAMLGTSIKVDGGPRAKWLQDQLDSKIYFNLRQWVEYGAGYGTAIVKPDGDAVNIYTYGNFAVTHTTAGKIDGAVFMTEQGDYKRLEYHRFLKDGTYAVSNRALKKDRPVSLESSPWADLEEDVLIANVDRPLFGVLKMPKANNIDKSSPYALPVFASAMAELQDLDVAYSRNGEEIYDSSRTVLIDGDRLSPGAGTKIDKTATGYDIQRQALKLPRYVKGVSGTSGTGEFYQEINPSLRTADRLSGINYLLGQIGFKAGFSNGYFVFNEKTGMVTATQVEADDRRTIQFIKDVRDRLEDCLDGLIYALDKFADIYNLAPLGGYKVVYDFGDITYNREEDRLRWWGYVQAGKVPAWEYFVKFEGLTEAEAKAMVEEAKPKEPRLFAQEE